VIGAHVPASMPGGGLPIATDGHGFFRPPSGFGPAKTHPVLQFVIRNIVLTGPDLAADRNAGLVETVGVTGNQGMPPIESRPIGQQAVAAGRRQPDDSLDISWVRRTQSFTFLARLG